VIPLMASNGGGQVLVTASLASLIAPPGDVAYAASKHALVGLVSSLGHSLGQHKICPSALCPGTVDTPLVPRETQETLRGMGMPVSTPADVAEAAPEALDARFNGSLWTIWGSSIRQHRPPLPSPPQLELN
jgi:short-subunit dehydrogenase